MMMLMGEPTALLILATIRGLAITVIRIRKRRRSLKLRTIGGRAKCRLGNLEETISMNEGEDKDAGNDEKRKKMTGLKESIVTMIKRKSRN